jgi:tRNA-2-methylthio-N6-dimethylallyladenosine synthase
MEGRVDRAAVQERFDRLVEAQERISLERNRAVVGARVEVLVEEPWSRKDPARATARTRTNKVVHLPASGRAAGEFLDVVVTAAHPHHLDAVPA